MTDSWYQIISISAITRARNMAKGPLILTLASASVLQVIELVQEVRDGLLLLSDLDREPLNLAVVFSTLHERNTKGSNLAAHKDLLP